MSQPALSRPKPATTHGQLQRRSGPSIGTVARSPVTYGDLLHASREAANAATQLVSTGRRHRSALTPQVVRDELDGYERFLVTATRHILALLRIAEIPVGAHWDAPDQQDKRTRHLGGPGYWHRA